MKKNNLKIKNAFSIIETLIALLAISVMIGGPLVFVHKSFTYAQLIKNKTIASGLAQEGLELATAYRNYRTSQSDYNKTQFIADVSNCSVGCKIDWNGQPNFSTSVNSINLQVCADEVCRLKFSTGDTTFTYRQSDSADIETDFYRQLKFVQNNTESWTVDSRVYIKDEAGEIKVDVTLRKILYVIDIK